jgi:3-hydroxyacyl-CoA dehydrogenase / enoyl-CoA hydratase / 3-hydroxybutyryl-CoA epimerase
MDLVNFKWDQDSDGIVTLTWDMPKRTLNVVSMDALHELTRAVEAVVADAAIKGLVITSSKAGGFCAGADLNELSTAAGAGGMAQQVNKMLTSIHQAFRRMETCGKPVAAAINGTALGGGFEVTLACHYRVAADNPRAQIGLPESQVGLLPGFGGTQRLPRLIGAANALQLMTQGTRLDPQKALAQGLVQKVVAPDALVSAAKDWIKTKPAPVQPWDTANYRIPGGGPFSSSGIQVFMVGNAMLRQKTYDNYPAQNYILSCVYEGLLVDIDTGLKIETGYFLRVMADPTSRNMIRTLFQSMQDLGKGARRPPKEPPTEVKRLGVLGAGVMGAGIAYVSALAGIDVTLVDTTQEKADGGKKHASDILDKEIQRGRSTPQKKEEVLGRIHTTIDFSALKDTDLVIEAVFEDRAVKAEVTKKTDAATGDKTIYGSNTSTLPITGLAEASARPQNFIGIHFFSPVERMMLVELIVGKQTGDRALATAVDYVRKIKKTPIVVNDARGFYTSRCFMRYVDEGLHMLVERITPALIENAGRMSGMPMGPMEVLDSVGIDTSLKITRAYRKEALKSDTPGDTEKIMAWIVEENGRPGVKAGKGFYEYGSDGKKTRLWPELFSYGGKEWRAPAEPTEVKELEARFLTIQALEAARAFEDGVVTDPRDADVGAILGWGFAPYTGGPLSYIDTMGAAEFVRRCERMAKAYGDRFTPNALLKDMAAKKETFYRRFAPKQAA